MEVLYPRCAGLDVHKDTVVAARTPGGPRPARTESSHVRHHHAGPAGAVRLAGGGGCTHVAMEATGIYWKPVWHILADGEFTLILANAAHVKNVPGRKTDVADATWLADLLAHGLIRASFVPGDANAGDARPAAHPQAAGARAGQPRPAATEDARGRQPQARLGADPHHGVARQ